MAAREGQQRVPLALGEQVGLGADVAEGVPLDRLAGEVGADRERERDGEDRGDPDRREQPRSEAHSRTAL